MTPHKFFFHWLIDWLDCKIERDGCHIFLKFKCVSPPTSPHNPPIRDPNQPCLAIGYTCVCILDCLLYSKVNGWESTFLNGNPKSFPPVMMMMIIFSLIKKPLDPCHVKLSVSNPSIGHRMEMNRQREKTRQNGSDFLSHFQAILLSSLWWEIFFSRVFKILCEPPQARPHALSMSLFFSGSRIYITQIMSLYTTSQPAKKYTYTRLVMLCNNNDELDVNNGQGQISFNLSRSLSQSPMIQ